LPTRGEDGVYLHVGVPKTGTTYVQSFLWFNRGELARRGLLFAAERRGDHFAAAVDLAGGHFAGHEIASADGAWVAVSQRAAAWEGRSLLSHEMFGSFGLSKITAMMSAFEGRRVHLILTLRDLARIVPATWQEAIKNQRVESWSEFLERVRVQGEEKRDARFWRLQNVPRILRDWSEFVPPERIHLVTVPPQGAPRTLLLDRFLSVFGETTDGLDLDVPVANESIGAAEVAVLQRVNAVARERMDWDTYHEYVKHFAVSNVLVNRPNQVKITLPDSELPWLRAETRRIRAIVDKLQVDVIGDIEDLTPRTAGKTYVSPESVSEDAVVEAAVDLSVGMIEAYADLRNSTRTESVVSEAVAAVRRGGLRGLKAMASRAVAAYRRARSHEPVS
jgi:hypothetical protein